MNIESYLTHPNQDVRKWAKEALQSTTEKYLILSGCFVGGYTDAHHILVDLKESGVFFYDRKPDEEKWRITQNKRKSKRK